MAVIVKTIQTTPTELISMAQELVKDRPKDHTYTCFIPYIDEEQEEIRYIKFTWKPDGWTFESML